jgi:transcriptional regulator with XRE-family HTH domain
MEVQVEDQAKQERIKAKAKELKADLYGRSLILEVLERGAEFPDELSAEELRGILIKLTRMWHGWSQPQLAKRSGVRVETISRLEHGQRQAQHSTIGALARAMRVNEKDLDPGAVFGIWRDYVEGEKERAPARKEHQEKVEA